MEPGLRRGAAVNRQTLPSPLIFRANFSPSRAKSNVSVTIFPQKDFICRRVKLRYPNRMRVPKMQLASQNRRAGSEGLAVDLLGADRFAFPESRAAVRGLGDGCRCRGHDRAEDRQRPAVAMRCAVLVRRALPAPTTCASYKSRTIRSDRRGSRALGSALPDRRDDLCRCARGMVHGGAARQRRCRGPHDLPDRRPRWATWQAARAGPMDGRGYSTCRLLLACGPTDDCAGASMAAPIYIGMAVVSAVFFLALKQISTTCSGFSFERTWRASARRRWLISSIPR